MIQSKSISVRATSRALVALGVAGGMLALSVADSSAQVLRRGAQGAVVGGVIGAITGGGKGAGKGAAIGAAVGGVVGAAEASSRRPPPPPPPPSYARPAPPPPPAGPRYGLVYDIQVSLTRLGYAPGIVDGRYGRRTGRAISAYQHDYQLLVTGQPSPALLDHMRAHGG